MWQYNHSDTLYHHGIKGQRWGVRRYQNEDGSLTKAGERRYANQYNYRDTDKYKNASRGEKATMSNVHNTTARLLGRRAANRIDYKVNEKGADRNKEVKKEYGKQLAVGIGVTLAATVGKDFVLNLLSNAGTYTTVNNLAAGKIGQVEGLNEVKGGFTPGFGAVRRGKKIYESMMKAS